MKRKVHVEKAYYDESDQILYLACNDVGPEGEIVPITRVHPSGEQRCFREIRVPASCFYSNGNFNDEMHKTASMFIDKKVFIEDGKPGDSDDAIKFKFEINDKYKD